MVGAGLAPPAWSKRAEAPLWEITLGGFFRICPTGGGAACRFLLLFHDKNHLGGIILDWSPVEIPILRRNLEPASCQNMSDLIAHKLPDRPSAHHPPPTPSSI